MPDYIETSAQLSSQAVNFVVPATTVDGINSFPFPIILVVTTAGTLTVIKFGLPGATVTSVLTVLPGLIIIPPGYAINLTYSVAPAWSAFGMTPV